MPTSILRNDLVAMLNQELNSKGYQDYCPNGLQVEGSHSIQHIVSGVTACQKLIEQAITLKADAILVHHGYFWKGEAAEIVGMKKRRINSLLKHNINLLAYHLPLDCHPSLGNNAILGAKLGFNLVDFIDKTYPQSLGNIGLCNPITAEALSTKIEALTLQKPLLIKGGDQMIKKVAWCTGAAQSLFLKALDFEIDAFISGEISEATVHYARENQVHYFACGHHATERFGVQALGEWISDKTGVQHTFIDVPSPV